MRKLLPLALLLLAACTAPTAETTGAAEDAIDSTDDGVSGASPGGGLAFGGFDPGGGPTNWNYGGPDAEALADQQELERTLADQGRASKAWRACVKACDAQAVASRAKCPPGDGRGGRDRTCTASVWSASRECDPRCDLQYEHTIGRDD